MKKIMVIGGYGQVGSLVCANLLNQGIPVIVAGRNPKSNTDGEKDSATNTECRMVDVTKWQDTYLKQVETVVMCLERNNLEVLEACIRCGVNYVDITPTGMLIEQLKQKKEEIAKAGIVVCVGVGIAPGVSNVLCENMSVEFEQIETIDSYIMLGIGESHGKNAVSWLVDNLNVTYDENGNEQHKVHSFSDGRSIVLDGENKKRRYVRIDMADWHIMKEKHTDAKVNSWYAYDKKSVTMLFEGMQKLGLLKLLKYEKVKKVFTSIMEFNMKVMKQLHFGTDRYAIMVEIKGISKGKHVVKRDMITGRENAILTAKMCALAVGKVDGMSSGFYYMDDLITREQIQ